MDLTTEEKKIIINVLSQISLSITEARVVIKIIEKIEEQIKQETQTVSNND